MWVSGAMVAGNSSGEALAVQCSSAAAPAGRGTAAAVCKVRDKNNYYRGDETAALV